MSGSNKRRDKNATTVYSPEKNATGDIVYPGIDAIRAWLESNAISEVECLVPDMTGNARGKFIPAHQFLSRADLKLPESIMIQTVTGEYTDEHWDFVEPTCNSFRFCLCSSHQGR